MVLPEALELVEEGLITADDFRDFTFANAVRLWGTQNPDSLQGYRSPPKRPTRSWATPRCELPRNSAPVRVGVAPYAAPTGVTAWDCYSKCRSWFRSNLVYPAKQDPANHSAQPAQTHSIGLCRGRRIQPACHGVEGGGAGTLSSATASAVANTSRPPTSFGTRTYIFPLDHGSGPRRRANPLLGRM
jgi:hypothetical protein